MQIVNFKFIHMTENLLYINPKFEKIGCIENLYDGFQQLPESPFEDCMFIYCYNKIPYTSAAIYKTGDRYNDSKDQKLQKIIKKYKDVILNNDIRKLKESVI